MTRADPIQSDALATPVLAARLPGTGTTIFSTMSALAAEQGAINLGQGFPDFDCDPALIELVTQAMQDGHNQYPPMPGVAPLRAAISAKVDALYGHHYDADSEITVTAGATQALLTAILCCVHPGDEVIVIEPAYDSYLPAIRLAGGVAVPVSMQFEDGRYVIPWERVRTSIGARTRLLIVNSPHNPTATIFSADDIAALRAIVAASPILLLSDEVYEHMVYDGARHESVCRYPDLAARAFVVSSFGKTYHVTGWKVGYCAAPAALSAHFRAVHQFNVFTVNTPVQYALAAYMQASAPYLELAAFYQRKRDLFRAGLAGSRFTLLPSQGSYFQCVRYDALSALPELDFARWLTSDAKVAAIPVSAFYREPRDAGIVRFCFAKRDETLALALARLKAL